MLIVRMRVEFGSSGTKQQIFLNGELKDEVTSTLPAMGPNEIDHAAVSASLKGPYLLGIQSKSDRQAQRYAKLDLAEVIVWNTLLQESESSTLLQNLKSKYCIS